MGANFVGFIVIKILDNNGYKSYFNSATGFLEKLKKSQTERSN